MSSSLLSPKSGRDRRKKMKGLKGVMNSMANLSAKGPSFATQIIGQTTNKKNKSKETYDSKRGSLIMRMNQMEIDELETVEEKKVEEIQHEEKGKQNGGKRMSSREMKLLGVEDRDINLFEEVMGLSSTKRQSIVDQRRSSQDVSDSDSDSETESDGDFEDDPYNMPFESKFRPDEMRCLALVAHNHMKPAMKDFVLSHQEVLKKFRLTGTNTTMTMLKTVFGDDPNVMYGPTCQSGPLGGDAELCALMCLEDLGGMIFFVDPLSAHPHQADIDCLVRLANVHNIMAAPNPTSAHSLCFVLKCSLEEGRKDKIPSFFYSLQSPGVKVYKDEQKRELQKNTTPDASSRTFKDQVN